MPARNRAGYLLIDHSASPGVSAEQARALGRIGVAEGQVFEADAYSCGHCQRTIVNDPAPFRTRQRGYCRSCDRDICRACEAVRVASGYVCLPIEKVLDLAVERIHRGVDPSSLLLV